MVLILYDICKRPLALPCLETGKICQENDQYRICKIAFLEKKRTWLHYGLTISRCLLLLDAMATQFTPPNGLRNPRPGDLRYHQYHCQDVDTSWCKYRSQQSIYVAKMNITGTVQQCFCCHLKLWGVWVGNETAWTLFPFFLSNL